MCVCLNMTNCGGVVPYILNLDTELRFFLLSARMLQSVRRHSAIVLRVTELRRVVSFTKWLFYFQRRSSFAPPPPSQQEDGRAQIPSEGCEGKEDLSPCPGIEPALFGLSYRRLVTMPTELSCLLFFHRFTVHFNSLYIKWSN
jgi:hypothetical protein